MVDPPWSGSLQDDAASLNVLLETTKNASKRGQACRVVTLRRLMWTNALMAILADGSDDAPPQNWAEFDASSSSDCPADCSSAVPRLAHLEGGLLHAVALLLAGHVGVIAGLGAATRIRSGLAGLQSFESTDVESVRCPSCRSCLRAGLPFAQGVASFALSLVPPVLAWLLPWLGLHPSRADGLAHLEEAASAGHEGARLGLLMIAIFFTADAAEVARGLGRIDHSTIFGSYVVGFAARERAQLSEARAAFERVRELAEHQCPTLARLALYEVGQVNLLDGRFEEAAAQLTSFVDTHSGRSFASFAAFQAGVAAVLAGGTARSEDAKRMFTAAVARARRHYSYDRYAARKATEYLAVGPPGFFGGAAEKQLVLAELELRAHRFEQVVRRLQRTDRLVPQADADRRALASYYRGAAMRCLSRDTYSRAAVDEVLREAARVGAHASREQHARPYALVELAEVAALAGEGDEATRLLDEASAVSTGYDFDLPLRRRVLRDRDALRRCTDTAAFDIPAYGVGIAVPNEVQGAV